MRIAVLKSTLKVFKLGGIFIQRLNKNCLVEARVINSLM